MDADDLRKLEDRIVSYVANVPEMIALMLYRQLHRGREIQMYDIDARICKAAKKAEVPVTCSCQGRHKADVAFSHWLAGDGD